ncbi:MAG: hypothetical protein IIY70_00630 [Oscillospiraceae bacterium]|nr:hypothetical protein [Oscillospiraceae bacterium]
MKRNKTADAPVMDEREQLIWLKSMGRAYLFLQLCLMGLCYYHFATSNDSAAFLEFAALMASLLVVLISQRFQGEVDTPSDHFGKPLPVGKTALDRRSRYKAYLKGALLMDFLFALLGGLSSAVGVQPQPARELVKELLPGLGSALEILAAGVLTFAVILPFLYLVWALLGEYQVRRYNQKMARLDREDAEEISE